MNFPNDGLGKSCSRAFVGKHVLEIRKEYLLDWVRLGYIRLGQVLLGIKNHKSKNEKVPEKSMTQKSFDTYLISNQFRP